MNIRCVIPQGVAVPQEVTRHYTEAELVDLRSRCLKDPERAAAEKHVRGCGPCGVKLKEAAKVVATARGMVGYVMASRLNGGPLPGEMGVATKTVVRG